MAFNIDPASWAELNRLLDQALDLPEPDRLAWVESLDQTHSELKPRLRQLLARSGGVETRDFLQTLPKIDGGVETLRVADRQGTVVGPYRLLRELGRGGMGTVWLAERSDGLMNRHVALKLPHGFAHRSDLAERLAREREILAQLNHPNIATLFDAGIADGQPYLALEYIQGEAIDVYCRKNQLDLKMRLKLFAQVANAVAFAHAKLVVHRDLKPSNILVTGDGHVRLLDFGIAKLLEDGTAKHTYLTELSGRALTPDYASPEQVLGEPITIASDVYSLGVILYELLTGERPYKLKRDSRGALEDAIVQSDPRPPSEAVKKHAAKALRGDLDTIVLKALKKKSEERYATVNALVDDIFRYLDRQPVLAQPDSRRYRAKKFVTRNRWAVASVAAVMSAIMVGSAIAVWQARVAIAERERADRVREFIAGIFRDGDPFAQRGGRPETAKALLDRARTRLEQEAVLDAVSRVELMNLLAYSYWGLGEYEVAERLSRATLATARAATQVSPAQGDRAMVVLVDSLHGLGKVEEAKRELSSFLTTLSSRKPLDVEMLATAKHLEATFEINEGRLGSDRAYAASNQALQLAQTLKQPNSIAVRAHQSLAAIYRTRSQLGLARDHARQAFEQAQRLYGADGRNPRTILAENEYGRALQATGDLRGAVHHLQRAFTNATLAYSDNNAVLQHLQGTLAAAQLDLGRIHAALESLRDAVALSADVEELSALYRASQQGAIGRALLRARRPAEALDHYRLGLANPALQDGRSDIVTQMKQEAAYAAALTGDLTAAANALEALLAAQGGGQRSSVQLQMLATVERLRGDSTRARKLIDDALTGSRELANKPVTRVAHKLQYADALTESGLLHLVAGDTSAALAAFQEALQRYDSIQDTLTPARVDALLGMARAHLSRGDNHLALSLLIDAERFWFDFDPDSRDAGEVAYYLGRVYLALNRRQDAAGALKRAQNILSRSSYPGDNKLAKQAAAAM